jgi:hypothetical protein
VGWGIGRDIGVGWGIGAAVTLDCDVHPSVGMNTKTCGTALAMIEH